MAKTSTHIDAPPRFQILIQIIQQPSSHWNLLGINFKVALLKSFSISSSLVLDVPDFKNDTETLNSLPTLPLQSGFTNETYIH